MKEINHNQIEEVAELKRKAIEMFEQALNMLNDSFAGLMKHDIHILNHVLKGEERINQAYNNLTAFAIDASKKHLSDKNKKTILDLLDIISSIEEIADRCVDLVEQIEYKIRENLLFSDTGIEEYQNLHQKVTECISGVIQTMKNNDKALSKQILKNKPVLDSLVAKYRTHHIERCAKGICDEWARIRYLEILDLTREIAHYCMKITDKLIKRDI